MSMKKGYKTVFAALMGCSMMTPAFGNETVARVQGASTNNAEMSIPKILLPVKPSKDDDNDENWNHIAIMNINMSGYTINNLITDVTNSTSAVNMETLVSYLDDVEGDNLGNHVATQTLNLSNNKITNLADAYDGADGDAVNVWTLKKYISEIPGDNLGNHVASQTLNLNNNVIQMGPITGYDQDTGAPIAGPGLVISNNMVSGLALPKATSDAANKEYVDGLFSNIKGDNLGNHTATQNINAGNFKVVNLALPTAGGDAANKTYVDSMISGVSKYKAGDGISIGVADANGMIPINVNSTVVRTSGNQRIGGNKNFTGSPSISSAGNSSLFFRSDTNGMKAHIYTNSNDTSFRIRNYAADNTTIAGELTMTATGLISPTVGQFDGNNKQISMVADPTNPQDAVNLRTMQAYTPAGDNLGNHTATQALNLATFKAVGMGDADLAVDSDGVNVKTLKAYVAANGDNLGNHTATQNINVGNFKVVNVAAPTAGGDATNKTYVDNLFYSAAKYKAGDGVSFGAADASGLVPINVDNTVVRTAGNQSIAGTKTFTARVAANAGITLNNQTAQMMADPVNPQDGVNLRTLLAYTPAGDNLGNHTATQALNLATFKAVGMGDANLAVDSDGVNVKTLKAYVAANGDDLGNHTATTNINVANNRVINVAAPVNGGDVTNKTYVDNLFSSAAKYKAGDGVSFGAADASGLVPINVDATVVRTAGNQTINGVKSFTTSINVDSNSSNGFRMRTAAGVTQGFIFTDAAGTHIRNYATDGTTIASELIVHNNGSIYPATGYLDANSKTIVKVADPVNGTDAVNLRTLRNYYTGGSGVNIGSAGVVSVDNTVVRTSGNQVINGNKSFYGTTSFGNATGGSFIEDTTLRNYGNAASLGMQAGGYFPGYGDSTGQTWWGTTRFVVDGSLKRQEPTITGLPAYYSPSIVFGILKPSAMTVMDPNDNGFGVVMAMGYKHVRIYRPVKIEGSLSLEAPTGSLETNVGQITLRAGTKSTGSIRLLSNDADIILDPNFGVTGTSVIRLRADTWISGVSRASGGHVTASDRRLKKNIETITAEAGLDIIRRLRPVTYDFKEGNRHAEGLIAQEVREVMPHAVSEGPDGYLGVEYDQMIAPLIASVQDLDKQVQGLRAETVSLDARLDKLEAAKN